VATDPDLPLARDALRRLGLDARFRRVATGLDTTYRADTTDGRRLAVRVAGPSDFRRPEATAMEAAWLRAIARDTALVVPQVIAPEGADPFAVHDAERRSRGVLVLSWVAGRKMRWRFAAHHARSLGAVAAVLHHQARAFVPPPGAWAKTWSPAALVGSGDRDTLRAVAGPDVVGVIERVLERRDAAFADLGSTDWTLVNADLGPHNVVWHERAPALFDFNDLGWGYTGFDLARALHGLRWRPNGAQLVAAALDGYRDVAPLPESFVRHGHAFEAAAGLFLAHYLAGKVAERGEDAARTIRDAVARADRLTGGAE
jgi:Ser/Thr protein kinase RdoA (MazF antagonist)